jgi:hypothetical protein
VALDKALKFDADAAVKNLLDGDPDYRNLRPDETLAEGARRHQAGVYLVGLVTLFVASLLFLTLAQFTRRRVRGLFAAAGASVALVAAALWVVVEKFPP